MVITPVKPRIPQGKLRNSDGFFFYNRPRKQRLDKIAFTEPSLTIAQQLASLQEKGLLIQELPSAEQWLSYISYFRFKHYSTSFKDYKSSSGTYIQGTTFEMVKDLYYFDRKIRVLIFEALENIEVAVKTQLTNIFAAAKGSHWYLDPQCFISEEERKLIIRNAKTKDEVPKVFNHDLFLKDIEEGMKSPDEYFLQIYKRAYHPIHPPSWMMVEMITFGTLSLLFENLKPCAEKTAIHEHFSLTKKHFISWLHCFSYIRNKCAHHARLIYTKVNFAPSLPLKKSRQFLIESESVDNASLYAILCCIQYMLEVCNKSSLFKQHLITLINNYPGIQYDRLGFTPHWRKEKLWS